MAHLPSRRQFLRASSTLGASLWLSRTARAQQPRTRLVLLGTGGGPTPKKGAAATAQAIIIDDSLYVVDCGNGVSWRWPTFRS